MLVVRLDDNAQSETISCEENIALSDYNTKETLKLELSALRTLSVPGQQTWRKSSGTILHALAGMAEKLNGNDEMSRRPTAEKLEHVVANPRIRSWPSRLIHSTIVPLRQP